MSRTCKSSLDGSGGPGGQFILLDKKKSEFRPVSRKSWKKVSRVGPSLGVLGRGCYLVFNARLVCYRYPTSKWMSDCRSQWIAVEWKQGGSVPLLPLALSRGGLHVWALPLRCLGVGATLFSMQDSCVTCLLYTSPSPRDRTRSRMPSSA